MDTQIFPSSGMRVYSGVETDDDGNAMNFEFPGESTGTQGEHTPPLLLAIFMAPILSSGETPYDLDPGYASDMILPSGFVDQNDGTMFAVARTYEFGDRSCKISATLLNGKILLQVVRNGPDYLKFAWQAYYN